jgi:hypothetical protein
MLPDPSRVTLKNSLPQVAAIDLCHDLSGVEAEWRPEMVGARRSARAALTPQRPERRAERRALP